MLWFLLICEIVVCIYAGWITFQYIVFKGKFEEQKFQTEQLLKLIEEKRVIYFSINEDLGYLYDYLVERWDNKRRITKTELDTFNNILTKFSEIK